MVLLLALLLAGVGQAADGRAAELARGIRGLSLNPEECYRVRDLTLIKEDARFFLTDGYLLFAAPVGGRRFAAVFSADVDGGDAEVIVLPPERSERKALATHTQSPNLDEHFSAAVLIFTDDSDEVLLRQIRAGEFNKKAPEAGSLLAQVWEPVARNLVSSYESRLVLDMIAGRPPADGAFVATVQGKQLGNFDVFYDPLSSEQLTVGQLTTRDGRSYFDVWTSFETRSFRNGARRAPGPEMELSNYRIEARIEADLKLKAVTRVKMRPSASASRVIPFEISRQMRVSDATIDGQPVEVFQWESMRSNLIRNSTNELLLLIPPQPLAPGRDYEVEVRHEGAVIVEAAKQVYAVTSRSNWYPARGVQFTTFDLTFRFPKTFDLVSAGDVVEQKTEGEWTTVRRRIPSLVRFAGFNLGVYQRVRAARGGNTVEVCGNRQADPPPRPAPPIIIPPQLWGRLPRPGEMVALPPAPSPPPNSSARLQELASEVAGALEFMAARFGPPPLRHLTVSPVPGAWGQGFPGLVYLSALAYLPANDRTVAHLDELQRLFFSDILQAHETAHQWWGNVVTAAAYHDDWILEALANYSALLYLEKRRGTRSLEAVLEEYRTNLLRKGDNGTTVESAGPIVLGSRLESSQTPRAWRTITYEKGSWIIHMLRRRMGDERFDAMLGQLLRRYERKPISTDQFRLLAAEFLPPNFPDPKLETFFDQWVYSTGIPTLELKASVRGKAPAVKVTVTVKQSDVPDDFSVLAPVEIQFARGKSITRWLRTGDGGAEFALSLRQPPLKVLLDPGSSVLAVKR